MDILAILLTFLSFFTKSNIFEYILKYSPRYSQMLQLFRQQILLFTFYLMISKKKKWHKKYTPVFTLRLYEFT